MSSHKVVGAGGHEEEVESGQYTAALLQSTRLEK
ncbi:hypothetical protein Q3H59_004151 [Pantoea sp. SORGH_AS 659]|nr:hypothetical protein [Pantoea sp. SORGH_AS_0659]